MLKILRATVHHEKIELLEQADLFAGTNVLVTLLLGDEAAFWLQTSQVSPGTIRTYAEDLLTPLKGGF